MKLGEGMRKSGLPRPKFDFRDLPHDWSEPWDEKDVRKLKQLLSDGYTIAEVADWLGRTPAGVSSKIYRLRRDEVSWTASST